MHKHPTPLSIKNHVLFEIIKAATDNNISPLTTTQMINALEAGIKKANQQHDLLKEVSNV
jgi:glutamate racemase